MPSSDRLETYLAKIRESEGIPPFARHAQELVERSLNPEGAASAMVEIILKDLGLTSHLLRITNSSMYNRSGKRISSVGHAVALLGFDTVRDIVSSMHFIEHYARQSPRLRELMMFALLTATQGRQIAAKVGFPRPEEAYVSALFRNIGEIMMARYSSLEHAEMLVLMQRNKLDESQASIKTFGFNYDEIARRLADSWNLPPCIRVGLDRHPEHLNVESRCLGSAVNYSHGLTSALYRHPHRYDALSTLPIINMRGGQTFVARRELEKIVACAIEDTKETFATLHIPISTLKLDQQAQLAREVLTAEEAPPPADLEDFDGVISGAERQIAEPGFDVSALIQRLLDGLTRYAGFDRAVFALLSKDRSLLQGRLVSGSEPDQILKNFQFPLQRGDAALATVIIRKQDLWVDTGTDERYASSRLATVFDPSSFALLPINVDGVVGGTLYVDRHRAPAGSDIRTQVERIRRLIATGIARKRASG